MTDFSRTLKRLLALGLSSALIVLSAGIDAYAAAGRAIDVSGAHAGPSAMPASAVSIQVPSLGLSAIAQPGLPGASLGIKTLPGAAALPGASAEPSLAPTAAGLPSAARLEGASASAAPAAAAAAANAAAPNAAEASATGGVSALDSAAGSLEKAQPTSVARTSRIASVVRSLRSVFGTKAAAENVPAGAPASVAVAAAAAGTDAPAPAIDPAARLQASAANAPSSAKGASGAGQSQPPAPPAGDDNGGGGKDDGGASLKAAWRGAIIFITAMLVAQVGIEAWAAASPKWVQTTFGKDGYATMTMVGMGVSLASGFVSGWLSDKLGIKKTAVIATVLYAGAAAALLLAFNAGVLTFPVLLGIAAARTFLGSASATAEQIIPIAIFKDHKDSLEKFNSTSQFILEVAGIGVPFMIGSLLLTFGSIGTMWILPVTMAASGLMMLLVAMSDVKKDKKTAAAPAKSTEGDSKLLRMGLRIYPAVVVINSLLYSIVALSYGNYVHPGASPAEQALAAGVAGKVVSLYSAGGLIAAAILSGIPGMVWGWLRAKFPALDSAHKSLSARFAKPDSGLSAQQQEIKRISKWLMLAAVSLVCFVPMLWTNPLIVMIAMIPFGIANVMSSLQVVSMVQRNVAQDKKGKTMGTLRTVLTLLGAIGMFGFSALFKHFPASPMPFMVLLGLLSAIGAYYVVYARKLSAYAATKTGGSEPPAEK